MLDLIFLVLMIIILVKAIKGVYMEKLCSAAMVVGFLAGIVGLVFAFFSDDGDSKTLAVLNVIIVILAFVLRYAAKHFVKLYNDKEAKLEEERRKTYERYHRGEEKPPVYTDDNFDDPELRFGKGGYTEYED